MTSPNNAQQGQGYASASLYIGDLPTDVAEPQLFEIFNAVGPVQSVRICRDAATRRSLGYGYVNFHRVEDAERALETMNFTLIRGKACRIMWSHRDPSLRKSGAGNIFVKNLNKSIDNKTLYDTFSMFGNILSCKVATDSTTRESLGYGFVHYENEESAKNAIQHVNGMEIADQQVEVMPFKSRVERGTDNKTRFTNVYAKNLPEGSTEESFRELFSPFGEITSIKLAVDGEGKSRGFGFVNFAEPEQAAECVEKLNGKEVGAELNLYVSRAQTKGEREKELREQFEQMKIERQKKYEGVNLYVKNLSDDINDERLREEFSKFGDITSAKVMKDNTGKSRGFGFVCYSSPDEATKAVSEMNGRMLDNKPLYVGLAQRKEYRRAQLEAQYAARVNKIPLQQPGMYPPQANPMGYFPQGMPAQRVVYPQPVGMRRWNPQHGQQPMMGVNPMYNMAMQPQQQQPQRPGAGAAAAGRGNNAAAAGARRGQPQAPANVTGGQMQPMVPQAITVEALAQAPEEQQKQMIGERLFPLIHAEEPALAAKITGMLLEMDNGELLHLLESSDARHEKIQEALTVLKQHGQEAGVEGQ